MWRYIFVAVSVALAATQYPALFQEKADEVAAARDAERERKAARDDAGAQTAKPASHNRLAGRSARIESDGRGHFVARAKMNGRSLDVLVDTGATLVAINETTARRLGIRLKPSDFKYRVRTANGVTEAAAAMIDEIRIGRVIVRDVRATVSRDEALSTVLLGMSFLGKLRRFEIDSGTLVLTQ